MARFSFVKRQGYLHPYGKTAAQLGASYMVVPARFIAGRRGIPDHEFRDDDV
jgi:hypothetical protein